MALHPPSAIAPGGLRASKSFPTAGDVRSPFSLIFRRPQQQNRSLSDSKSMMTASPYLKAVSGVFSTSSSRNAARDNKKPPLCRSVVSCLLRRPHDLVHSLPCGLMASVYPFNRSVPCLWRHYFQIIFVMDNNGREPVVEARDELHRMLNELSYGDRMSFVMLCFWCSQTNKIFPMP